MREIQAPTMWEQREGELSVFLGGTIGMGSGELWQLEVMRRLTDSRVLLLNPRRADWDIGWVQSKENPQFTEQVRWGLDAQERADLNVYYFAPGSMSPVTLLEFGLFGTDRHDSMVCCPPGYARKGNIDIVCDRYDIPLFASLQDLIEGILLTLKDKGRREYKEGTP